MLQALGIGVLIFIALLLATLVHFDTNWLIKYSAWAGLGLLILAMITARSVPNGMAQGSHMQGQDNRNDQKRRNRWSSYLLLAALPNLLGALAAYLYIHR